VDKDKPITSNLDTQDHNWHIVVPVYNEAARLEKILSALLPLGYADKITFVNDASTDSSGNILDKWALRLRCQVMHLRKNAKKEGAIRKALEHLQNNNRLPEYTIVLDADSILMPNSSHTVPELIYQSIVFARENNISGMAFRLEAMVPKGHSVLQRCIYYDYTGIQFDNWLTSKSNQLWVINGPGGIFESRKLLPVLQSMVPDFETGDLLITVILMKNKERVAYWPHLAVKTWVPENYGEYFRQRRRWERGTIKVLWNERQFYLNQFRHGRILAIYVIIYLLFPAGIAMLPLVLALADAPAELMLNILIWNYLFWVSLAGIKCFWSPWLPKKNRTAKILFWSCLNGLLFLFATAPARITGFVDALKYFSRSRRLE